MQSVSNAVIKFLSSSKTRMAILGLLVLTTGVFTTTYMISQQQDIRQHAAGVPSSCNDCPNQYFCSTNSSTTTCSGVDITGYVYGVLYSCQPCSTTSQPPPPTVSGECSACTAEDPYLCTGLLGGTTCSRSSIEIFGIELCERCQIPRATSTPVPSPTLTPTTGTGTPTPTVTPSVLCSSETYVYSCGTGTSSGLILRRPITSPDSSVFLQCQGKCIQTTSGCFTCESQPQRTPTPTLTPLPTLNPECASSTGKALGCKCEISAHCASGFCELTDPPFGVCASTSQLTCDPNLDGTIDLLDFQWWRDEFTGVKTTKIADCFSPNQSVDLQDFQIWREIFITKERQPF